MKALTVIQPWASLIVHGRKGIENRVWKPFRSLVGKRIAIHAGLSWDERFPGDLARDLGELAEKLGIVKPSDLPRGAIVGTAIVVGYVQDVKMISVDQERWFSGPIGWILSDRKALPEPIPCRGSQGLWEVPEELVRRMAA